MGKLGSNAFYLVFSFICFAVFGSNLANAANVENRRLYKTFQCPAMHPEYMRLMDQIRGLKQQIEEKAECGALRNQVDSLADYVGNNRSSFVSEVTKKRDTMLSVEESRRLQNYANEASKRALMLIDLLNGDDGCVGEETKGQLLSRSSSIVYEAGNLLASVAGPYGVPIAIGSSVISGVLKGVAYFYENQSGFDFDEFEQRQFYAESVCQFYRFQQEAEELINPVATLQGLEKLKAHLYDKLSELEGNCRECGEMSAYYSDDYNRENEESFNKKLNELRVAANNAFASPLGNETLQTLRTIDWSQEQIGKYQTILSQERAGQGPRELMRESLAMSSFLFEEWAPEFVEWYFRSARREYREFQSYVYNWSVRVWMDVVNGIIEEKGLRRVPSEPARPQIRYTRENLDFIEANMNKSVRQSTMQSKWRKQEQLVQMSSLSMQVVADYCGFFAAILEYGDKIAGECEARSVLALKSELAKFVPIWKERESGPATGVELGEVPAPGTEMERSGERAFGVGRRRFEHPGADQKSWQSAMENVFSRWEKDADRFQPKD